MNTQTKQEEKKMHTRPTRGMWKEDRLEGMVSYCTQNYGQCATCALVNYDRDCHNNPVGKGLRHAQIREVNSDFFALSCMVCGKAIPCLDHPWEQGA